MTFDPLSKKLFATGAGFYLVVILCSLQTPFFWDTILTSSVAQWFYENGIQNAIAPLIWDAGHPTLFQIYLMTCWKAFGQTLAVSHLSMLPFLLLLVFTFVYITQRICISNHGRVSGLVLLLIHPYILTQSTLISYDILQIGFFMTCLIGITEKRKTWLLAGIWGLSACSIRGQLIAMVCLGCYLVFDYRNWKENILLSFVACAPICIWHTYHYMQTGWMISTPSSSWETHRNVAGTQQIISNTTGIIRGFADYGMIVLSMLFIYTLWFLRKEQISNKVKKILFTTFVLFLTLNSSMLLFSNPIGHRYFMVVHIGMILFITSQWYRLKFQKAWFFVLFTTFISGHFWLYPKERSNGWDVTLAYHFYEHNRSQLLDYLSEKEIASQDISSSFPLFCSKQQTHLNNGERMKDISELSPINTSYIAYSPVCNDMKDLNWKEITKKYQIEQVFGKGITQIILYKDAESPKLPK